MLKWLGMPFGPIHMDGTATAFYWVSGAVNNPITDNAIFWQWLISVFWENIKYKVLKRNFCPSISWGILFKKLLRFENIDNMYFQMNFYFLTTSFLPDVWCWISHELIGLGKYYWSEMSKNYNSNSMMYNTGPNRHYDQQLSNLQISC